MMRRLPASGVRLNSTTVSIAINRGAGCRRPGMLSAHCCWSGKGLQRPKRFTAPIRVSTASCAGPLQHTDNVWSLRGLHEYLEAPIIGQRQDTAAAEADVPRCWRSGCG